ncbi:hypothetical protein N7492_004859 [Penicillium capsulatum]|uniref:Nephrocystin 3-like N-terminal domain-containing protein n=1 Tax=Penicillium capsulatum TaxID=69766 RepID=A0A9W9I8Q5_9EURO|nr:hypothetical protein N7492_004859 [Penicillium capsulatum]
MNRICQLVGASGNGKSTMAAFLVRYLSQFGTVVYFFHDKCDSDKRWAIQGCRAILAQLLETDPSAADTIMEVYEDSRTAFVDSLEQVVTALHRAFLRGDHGHHGIYLVVDGLDECRDAFSWHGVFQASCRARAQIKCLVTDSSADKLLLPSVGQEIFQVHLDRRYTTHQIFRYIKHRAQQIFPMDLGVRMANHISRQAGGSWLYARVLVSDLEKSPSLDLIEARLRTLPISLSELFYQVLQTSQARMPDHNKPFAQALFLWLNVIDLMPPCLTRFQDSTPLNTLELVFQFVNRGIAVPNLPSLISKIGEPLVQCHPFRSPCKVGYIHPSARECLSAIPDAVPVRIPSLFQPRWIGNLSRAVVAIWYFTHSDDSARQLAELRDRSPALGRAQWVGFESYYLMDYALWTAFRATPLPIRVDTDNQEAERMLQMLTDFLKSEQCLRWVELTTITDCRDKQSTLVENVISTMKASQKMSGTSLSPASQAFNQQRRSFFENWTYVLLETTPWRMEHSHLQNITFAVPYGIIEDPIKQGIMHIAATWYQSEEMQESAAAIGSLLARRYICPHCSQIMPEEYSRLRKGFTKCPSLLQNCYIPIKGDKGNQ